MRKTITTAITLGLLATGLLTHTGGALAQEYDCRDETVCTPEQEGYSGCSFSAQWGALIARAWRIAGTTQAATEAGGFPLETPSLTRWIITTCQTVSFRPYADAVTEASTDHCWQHGPSNQYPCAGLATVWVTNTAGSGTGPSQNSFCGWLKCDFTKQGTVDHEVGGININVPGNKDVRVTGHAVARFYEDDLGNGCVLCGASLQQEKTNGNQGVTWWIGSTPPL